MALYRYVAEATLDYCMRGLPRPAAGTSARRTRTAAARRGGIFPLHAGRGERSSARTRGGTSANAMTSPPRATSAARASPTSFLNTRWNLLPGGYDDFREELRMYRSAHGAEHRQKILTAANGLMLMALSRAARAFFRCALSRRGAGAGGVHGGLASSATGR